MSSPPIALINARLVDPASRQEGRGGLLVSEGVIRDVGAGVTRDSVPGDMRVVDCGGDVVSPGLIDMRVFVGEPGAEHRETIASVSRAAAAGGVTTICVTPETTPAIDDPAVVDFLMRRARDNAQVRLLPVAALTKGLHGREIAEIGLLGEAGAVAFSNGRESVRDTQVMRRALTYSCDFGALIMHVAQDADLAGAGVMNEGELASRLGLTGIPHEAEALVLDRDMRLVAMTGARYHAELVSSGMSLDIISRAKAAGLKVSCGISINHLTLNENDIGDYRTFLKIMPPLRHEDERLRLVEGLASGVIDVIVSDHCGQDVEAKRVPFAEAEAGAIGLETLLAAGLRLVHAGQVSLQVLLRAMTSRPAEILRLPQGRLAKGAPADIIRFDPEEPFVVDPASLHARCKNTPFDEARLQGRVKLTLVAGAPVHE
ncbi:MAG: dihydroorotase [Hyphomicrobiales bacterium]|nr:dihydroorotase [Hyphomicrobiales bacterium]